MAEGFLVIDKPSGPTSHDVVSAVRRSTGVKRVGHAGTLDPMATGVLVVAVGRPTRLIRYIQDTEKEYVARVQFGVATDSLDADGAVVWREPMDFTKGELEAVLPRFMGIVHQVPPMISAIKVEGRRLYQLAREGKEIERSPRPVEIRQLEVVDFSPCAYPEASIRVVCGSGTYVRVLADDLARALGGRAHLTALRRTRIGHFTVDNHAIPLDRLAEWRQHLIHPVAALGSLKRVEVDAATAEAARHGIRFATGPLAGPHPAAVIDGEGRLVAVYREGKPEVVLG
jgi:tRNA pseudouridine55 synthase